MSASFAVDASRCVRCGSCAEDCVSGALSFGPEGPRLDSPDDCMGCHHCVAICPQGAVSGWGRRPGDLSPAAGLPSPEAFAALARVRRSVRQFAPGDVPPETLRGLVDTAWHAPTGVNAQGVFFAVVAARAAMDRVRRRVYARLDETLSRPGRGPGPNDDTLRGLAEAWRGRQADGLFRHAPHMVLACAGPQTVCREADPFIALSYLELAAATAGVGALWCGLGMMALSAAEDPALLADLGVPPDHQVAYAMMLGWPKRAYPRGVERGPARAAFVTSVE